MRLTTPLPWALLVALSLGALSAPHALAQEGPEKLEQAKSLFSMGAQLYAARKYSAAIQNFEEAYRLAPRPALLFSIAQAERRYYFETRQVDYLRRAMAHYKTYLAQAEQGGRRAEAGQALAELELVASKIDPSAVTASSTAPPPPPPPSRPTLSVMATQVKGAHIWVDGKPAEEGLFSEEVAPGKHTFKVSADGYHDEEREVTLQSTPLSFDVTLRPRAAALSFVTEADAQVSVDGRLVGAAPLPLPIEVPAGLHVVTVSRNGYEGFTAEVELARGETRTIEAPLRRTVQRKVSFGLLAVGGASLLAGGVFTALALRSEGRASDVLAAREQRSISGDELARYNDARNDRDARWRPAAIASFGVAAGLGLTGALLYVFDQPVARPYTPRERGPQPAPATTPTVPTLEISAAPALSPSFWGMAALGRF